MVELIQRNDYERLYLLKEGTNEIFVNKCQLLKQHQINGLRFLFMLFKKNKPGAIVNFPYHCGKSVTVALFLYAVRNLLENPVLILCKNENEMYKWKENLLKWTEFKSDDIIIESTKVLKGKKIFVKNIDNLGSFQQHSWGIVIIKGDLMNKEICRISNVRYKIWITSTDMKKDLALMAFIYDWLYPKLKLNVKDFMPDENNLKDIYLKFIYLDTFLEDFVTREEDIKQFNKTKNSLSSEFILNQINEEKSKPTRKNKDATGTKIKRSRRVIDDDIIEIPKENEGMTVMKVCHMQDEIVVVNTDNEHNKFKDLSDDNVIEDNKSNICNSIEYRQNASEVFTVGMACDINTTIKMDFTEPMSFGNAINEIVKNENDMHIENCTETIDFKNVIETDIENKKHFVENTDTKEGILDNSVTQSKQNVREEKFKDVIEDIETNIDANKTQLNESIKGHKDVDTMLSELEEKTLKKFKGSFLDSIF